MSVSALTTAMAVAAATVPNGKAPASVAAFGSELVAADHDPQEVGPAAGSIEAPPPLAPAQSTAPSQSRVPDQSTELIESTDLAQPTDPASSGQLESQALPPALGPTEIVVTGR